MCKKVLWAVADSDGAQIVHINPLDNRADARNMARFLKGHVVRYVRIDD